MHRKGVITCWSDSVKRELLYRCGGLQGALCRMDVFVYCCTLTCVFLSRISYTYTHTVFSLSGSHTLAVFAEVYSSLAENWFCNSLELGWREQGPRCWRKPWVGFPLSGVTLLWQNDLQNSMFLYNHWTPLEWGRAACVRSTFLVLMSYS